MGLLRPVISYTSSENGLEPAFLVKKFTRTSRFFGAIALPIQAFSKVFPAANSPSLKGFSPR